MSRNKHLTKLSIITQYMPINVYWHWIIFDRHRPKEKLSRFLWRHGVEQISESFSCIGLYSTELTSWQQLSMFSATWIYGEVDLAGEGVWELCGMTWSWTDGQEKDEAIWWQETGGRVVTRTGEQSIVVLTSNHRCIAGLSSTLDDWQSYWQCVDDWPDAIEP